MCFGDQTSTQNQNLANTGTSNQKQTAPAWLQNVAQSNVRSAQDLQQTGFQPYTGQQVADFSGQQNQSFGMGSAVGRAAAGNIMPGANALGFALDNNQSNAPTVNAPTISSGMSPYMNQYVNLALAPQLEANARAYQLQSQAQQGAATSAGAFGDPRAGILQGNLGLNYALENQGLVGNAYNAAFNTAIGASAQDVGNSLTAQNANANIWNQQTQNALAGSNAASGQATSATNLINTLGAQQTAQEQAKLNAQYNQYLMAQQYPFQTGQLINADIGAALPTNTSTAGNTTGTLTGTTTLTQPNNAGWGILGSLIGAGGSASKGLFAAAEGGEVPSGAPTLVGERGPEVFVPHGSGSVIPYEHLKKAMEKKKGVTVPKHRAPSFGIAA